MLSRPRLTRGTHWGAQTSEAVRLSSFSALLISRKPSSQSSDWRENFRGCLQRVSSFLSQASGKVFCPRNHVRAGFPGTCARQERDQQEAEREKVAKQDQCPSSGLITPFKWQTRWGSAGWGGTAGSLQGDAADSVLSRLFCEPVFSHEFLFSNQIFHRLNSH